VDRLWLVLQSGRLAAQSSARSPATTTVIAIAAIPMVMIIASFAADHSDLRFDMTTGRAALSHRLGSA
jgi:hypothetical protein